MIEIVNTPSRLDSCCLLAAAGWCWKGLIEIQVKWHTSVMTDYPAWIEALGTTGSLVAAIFIFRGESRRSRSTRASELLIYQDPVPFNPEDQKSAIDNGTRKYSHKLYFKNNSKAQFESLYVLARRRTRRQLANDFSKDLVEKYKVPRSRRDRARREQASSVRGENGGRVFLPDNSAVGEFKLDYPTAFYEFHIFFDDSAGRLWYRIIRGNPLLQGRALEPASSGAWKSIHKLYKDWDKDEKAV
jgi:hypothetical protein